MMYPQEGSQRYHEVLREIQPNLEIENGIRETENKHRVQPTGLGLAFSEGNVTISLQKNAVIAIHQVRYRENATNRSQVMLVYIQSVLFDVINKSK